MPRSQERDTEILFTEGIKLHKHNLLVQERQVFRSPFMCVSLRKQQTAYVAAVSVPCWVLHYCKRGSNSLVRCIRIQQQLFRASQTLQPQRGVV